MPSDSGKPGNYAAQINWSCIIRDYLEQQILFVKLQVNEYLQERLFPRIAG